MAEDNYTKLTELVQLTTIVHFKMECQSPLSGGENPSPWLFVTRLGVLSIVGYFTFIIELFHKFFFYNQCGFGLLGFLMRMIVRFYYWYNFLYL